MEDVIIRPYQLVDRVFVRHISYVTAFLGQAGSFIDGEETLSAGLTMYYTDYEPESSFVALKDGRVIGYVTGTTDTLRMRRCLFSRIYPVLFGRAVASGFFFNGKNWRFLGQVFCGYVRGEFRDQDFAKEYPASCHINILPEFRRAHVGGHLMTTMLGYFRQKKLPGVHLGTMSETAKNFFLKHGFKILQSSSRSYFKYVTGERVPYYILGCKWD